MKSGLSDNAARGDVKRRVGREMFGMGKVCWGATGIFVELDEEEMRLEPNQHEKSLFKEN